MAELRAKHFNRSSLAQLFRYGLVGVFSNSVGYLIYLLITFCGVSPKLTMSVLYVTGASIGFWGNRRWTFSHNGKLLGTAAKYVLTHFFGYLINLFILIVLVDHIGYAHQLVQAFAIIVVACYLFVVFKFFVFSKSAFFVGRLQ